MPPLYMTSYFDGESGKQLVPGNKGLRSIKVGAFSFNIP